MPCELDEWYNFPSVFLPSPLTSTESGKMVHVHTLFWGKAKEYVRNGGTLYASLSADAAIPGMAELFGAYMIDHDPMEANDPDLRGNFWRFQQR